MAGMQAMNDTPPKIAEIVRSRIMALSGEERFCMGAEMFEVARTIVLASLPPDLTEAERNRQLFLRFYGGDLPNHILGRPSNTTSIK
jgi:hypothetical protein